MIYELFVVQERQTVYPSVRAGRSDLPGKSYLFAPSIRIMSLYFNKGNLFCPSVRISY